jgi:hypothetical protein
MDSYRVPDERLVGLAREGEREAFDALFARYLLMEQTEHVMPEWWCIHEAPLFVAK